MSYDAAIYLYDAAGCQNDAAKPHFEGSQDTWMHSFLHIWAYPSVRKLVSTVVGSDRSVFMAGGSISTVEILAGAYP